MSNTDLLTKTRYWHQKVIKGAKKLITGGKKVSPN